MRFEIKGMAEGKTMRRATIAAPFSLLDRLTVRMT